MTNLQCRILLHDKASPLTAMWSLCAVVKYTTFDFYTFEIVILYFSVQHIVITTRGYRKLREDNNCELNITILLPFTFSVILTFSQTNNQTWYILLLIGHLNS
jgi:hypothetical protein